MDRKFNDRRDEPLPAAKAIAERFRNCDFHDDTFVGMTILPTQISGDLAGSVVEVRICSGETRIARKLRFTGCANLRVGLDFDVLARNLPPNTSRVDAHNDADLMFGLMEAQESEWDVGYGVRSPLDHKLSVLEELVCFRVQFFGGIVEIIARDFTEAVEGSLSGQDHR